MRKLIIILRDSLLIYLLLPKRIRALEVRLDAARREQERLRILLNQKSEQFEADLKTMPHVAAYQHFALAGLPAIYDDPSGARFACGNLHDYVSFHRTGSILDDLGLVRYIEEHLHNLAMVVDIGAHVGGFSILAARRLSTGGRLIAFEAQTDNFRLLEQNIALNQLMETVTLEHCAVFSSVGEIELHVFDQASGWHTLGHPTFEGINFQRVEQVRTTTLDDYCRAHHITAIDVLKIDVEGAEPDVLRGAKTLLHQGAIKLIIFEVSQIPLKGMGYTVDDILAHIPDHIYHIHRIMPDGRLVSVTRDDIAETVFGNFAACKNGEGSVV